MYKSNYMNIISIFLLKGFRKLYAKMNNNGLNSSLSIEEDLNKSSDIIYELLASDKPCMIARFGATELNTVMNYISITSSNHSFLKFIKGEQSEWWWNKKLVNQMQQWSGFFPPTEDNIERFCRLVLDDSKLMDICGVFKSVEKSLNIIRNDYFPNAKFLKLISYDPFVVKNPWSRILKGKKVLVIHPFEELIIEQYYRRTELFDNPDVLPDFELKTIKAVQSLGGVSNGFNDWFEALEWMKNEMDRIDYDICLIGCGAYGLPLAAHAKRRGKKAVHIGGGLQLLFGIKGHRWELPSAPLIWGLPKDFYIKLFSNPAWVRPTMYRNKHIDKVENACYW